MQFWSGVTNGMVYPGLISYIYLEPDPDKVFWNFYASNILVCAVNAIAVCLLAGSGKLR